MISSLLSLLLKQLLNKNFFSNAVANDLHFITAMKRKSNETSIFKSSKISFQND